MNTIPFLTRSHWSGSPNFFFAISLLALLFYPRIYSHTNPVYQPGELTSFSTVVVTTLADELNNDGDCSLREAMSAVNMHMKVDACLADSSSTSIVFSPSGNIAINAQLPDVVTTMIIDGDDKISIDGQSSKRVFYVPTTGKLTLQKLIVQNGYVSCCNSIGSPLSGGSLYNLGSTMLIDTIFKNNTAENTGGAVYSEGGSLTIYRSTFFENKTNFGAAIFASSGTFTIDSSTFANNSNLSFDHSYGGAIASGATTSISNCTFNDNKTLDDGGAIWVTGNSRTTITNSTFSRNSVTGYGYQGGLGGALAVDNNSSVIVVNSTFKNNWVNSYGGAIWVAGNSQTTITNSTFSKNGVDDYWGQGGALAVFSDSSAVVMNSTFKDNWAGYTGNSIVSLDASITLRNTIVSDGGDEHANCSGPIIDGGYNIDSEVTCGFQETNHSMSITDPMLGDLENNGAPILTHAPLRGSPAIDSGDCSGGTVLTDQRGAKRPLGKACDIGAYESWLTFESWFSFYLPAMTR